MLLRLCIPQLIGCSNRAGKSVCAQVGGVCTVAALLPVGGSPWHRYIICQQSSHL